MLEGKEIQPSYDSYTDYGETNGSYIVTLQVRNAPEINYEFPDPNSIYASHLAPIFNHICYTITAND